MSNQPELSIVIPCFEEGENLWTLYGQLTHHFPATGAIDTEFILVDDGSTEGSPRILKQLAAADPRVEPVFSDQRGGQTRAMWLGLQVARGEWIAHLDCDLQNDPADLPAFLRKAVDRKFDAVLGYRAERHDDLGRRLASRFANAVRRLVLKDSIRDIGCSTRVVRRDVLFALKPVPNLHRYLPALIERGGWSFVQEPTLHHDRTYGCSKYGNWRRGWESLRDLPRMARYIRELRSARRRGGDS